MQGPPATIHEAETFIQAALRILFGKSEVFTLLYYFNFKAAESAAVDVSGFHFITVSHDHFLPFNFQFTGICQLLQP
jgi:hypothetical protein